MISFLVVALKLIVLLGFLVFIHEFGHFIAAKLCKVKVNEFALGFGPVLISIQGKETKYQLRLIPLGGFVSMEGESSRSDSERAFNKVSIIKRILIVSAGGLVNIIVAILLFFGVQVFKGNNESTRVQSLISNYPAEQAGIMQGDKIVKINNKKMRRAKDIVDIVSKSKNNDLSIQIERNGEIIEFRITPNEVKYKSTGAYFESEESTIIEAFNKKNCIKDQGFKVGDKIISINNVNVENDVTKVAEVLQTVEDNKKAKFVIDRAGKNVEIEAEPVTEYSYLIGIGFEKEPQSLSNNLYYAWYSTGDFAFSIVDNLKTLISGDVSSDDVMGPVGISKVVAKKTDGISEFLNIMALISLSLGITNLLPFPPLDGGKNVLLIIEAIRKKPLQEKHEAMIQMIGFSLIILLSLYVTYNDILKVFRI